MKGKQDFIEAIGMPDDNFNAAMDCAFLRIRQEERSNIVKRKIRFSLVAAIVALLVLAGAALAVGVNLFEIFGKNDERLSRIAPQAELENTATETVQSAELGSTCATFNNGYYDGQSLIIAFTLENSESFAAYTPTEEQLSRMEKVDENQFTIPDAESKSGTEAVEAFLSAMQAGTPCGLAQYSVYPSDHCMVDENIDLSPWYEDVIVQEDGSELYLREFETPLPDEVRDLESINVHIKLKKMAAYFYYDGEDCYQLYDHGDEVTLVSALIPRTEAVTRTFGGEGEYGGTAVHVSASFSAVQGTICIAADEAVFTQPEDHCWYDAVLYDENGQRLRTQEVDFAENNVEIRFEGSGAIPESLTLYFGQVHEGKWELEDFKADAAEIQLIYR